jgi:hypothetical protein
MGWKRDARVLAGYLARRHSRGGVRRSGGHLVHDGVIGDATAEAEGEESVLAVPIPPALAPLPCCHLTGRKSFRHNDGQEADVNNGSRRRSRSTPAMPN